MFISWIWLVSIIATIYIADKKKLSVGGYLLLSFFIGPLALIIVFLQSERKPRSQDVFPSVGNIADAKQQLRYIQSSLYALEEKTKSLEGLINKLSNESTEVSVTNEEKAVPQIGEKSTPLESIAPHATKDNVKQSDMELDFGRNWLNKIGVAILALGVAFLISYSFQYFGPFLKIAFGYLVGGLLFFAGIKLEAKEKFVNYGRVLLGGAWAIIYFTTYAMHHFDASRIIANQTVDVALLAVVVAGMIMHALKYKSEAMMSVVLFVAYLTSTIGQITNFTILSSLFLSVLVLFFVYRFQWIKTLTFGIILTYGIHYIWVVPNLLSSARGYLPSGIAIADYYDFMNFIFLTCYWVLFLAGVHLVKNIKDVTFSRALAATNFGNIALYSLLSFPLILELFPAHKFEILLIGGMIYLALSLLMKKLSRENMYLSDIIAAVFAITFSITLKFSPSSTLLLWMIEIPFLLFIGVNFKERIFYLFSYTLSIIVAFRLIFLGCFDNMPDVNFLGLVWSWYAYMCFWASISMGICFYLSHWMEKDSRDDSIALLFDHIFSFASCFYLGLWIWSRVHQPWLTLSLSVEGIIFLALSFILRLKRFRAYAYLALAIGAIVFLFEPISTFLPVVKWLIILFNVLTIFGLYYAMKFIKQVKLSELFIEHEVETAFIAAIIMLVVAIYQYVTSQWISLSLGLASVLVITTGFFGGNKTERMGGMALLALTLGRVVLVDLSGLDIIFKIITFIILGVLFLGVSYIYNRFSIKGK